MSFYLSTHCKRCNTLIKGYWNISEYCDECIEELVSKAGIKNKKDKNINNAN